ncbi:MAG: aminotransferase class IV, partial [bacterium]
MIHKFCYFDGKIIPIDKARIGLDDLGILRGYGAFDFSRTYNGKLFHIKDQFARFKNSTKSIGLSVPVSQSSFEEILYKLLKKNKLKDASFRAVVTGGPSSSDMISGNKPIFYILVEPAYSLPSSFYKNGVKLILHEYMRYVPQAKTTNYIEAARLQKEKKRQKAFEILYTSDNKIFECSSSNFFLIKNN